MLTNRKQLSTIILTSMLALSVSTVLAQTHPGNVTIEGSLGVGFDITATPSFGFNTILMAENNTRIRFDDTSDSLGTFPFNDWILEANASIPNGSSHFAILDETGGTTPFKIEAGAGNNALYVDDGGRIGIGTATPVVDVHIVTGNTPTHRIEQDGSSGFTPQTWDVAGNEANFFIRDATNGSTLPFRIFPAAPSNSLTIEGTTGHVGLGTTSPTAQLDINSETFRLRGVTNVVTNSANDSVPAVGKVLASADDLGTAYWADTDDLVGPTGPTGPTGAAGTNGTNGTNGSDGATGPTGADGIDGTNGADGATGAVGAAGTNGTNGTNGSDGATGPTGADGADGTNGTDGIDGTNGADGATGAAGTDGIDGTNGADGATGAAGTDGTDGTNGSDGTNGADGADGATGPAGADGGDDQMLSLSGNILSIGNGNSVDLTSILQPLLDRLDVLETEVASCCGVVFINDPDGGSSAQLFQNYPNPYDESTIIEYYLPNGYTEAHLDIFTIDGSFVSRVNVKAAGQGHVVIGINAMAAGNYVYSLIADDELIGTRQMTISH